MRPRAPAEAPRVIRQLLTHLGVPNEVRPDPLKHTMEWALTAEGEVPWTRPQGVYSPNGFRSA